MKQETFPSFKNPSLSQTGAAIMLLLLVLGASASLLAHDCTGIPASECNALYALYESTNGGGWTNNANWLSSSPVGNWAGLTVESGHVTGIDFFINDTVGNGLIGELPPELGNLTELRILRILGDNLTGPIPPELGNLSKLEEIDFWSNALTGEIPAEIGGLVHLRSLGLSSNLLSGEIPPELANLTNLEWLGLSSNHLSGTIPSWLGGMTKLQGLGLASNRLSGPIPPELGNLTGLDSLGLYENKLTGQIPPELANLTELNDLTLRNNELTGPIPPELGNMTGLGLIDFSRNKLTGQIPPSLGNLIWLCSLNLSFNSLSGPIPPELDNLSNPCAIILHSNDLSGELPDFMANPGDQWFELKYNRLYASNAAALSAMEIQHHGKFLSTQTLAPKNVDAVTVETSGSPENRVEVSWNKIGYLEDPGGYQVYYRKKGDSEYTFGGMTPDKDTASWIVSGLEPGAEYEFMVKSVTWNHGWNGNTLYSEESSPVSAAAGTLNRAFIPVWKQSPEYFTGVVISNFGDTDFEVGLSAYGPNGNLESLGTNPAHCQVGAGLQQSLLGREFFKGDPGRNGFSWIELQAENSLRMGSIFLFGANDTAMLDGAAAQFHYGKRLFFTRPLEEGFFAGWNPDIDMCLVNPTDQEVRIICWLRGSNKVSGKSHILPPRGFIRGNAAALVSAYHGVINGYMDIEVTEGPGIIGFSRVEFPEPRTALGMNAVEISLDEKMYSAQLAHGEGIVTNLRLVNTYPGLRNVKLTAIADDGSLLASPVWVGIPAERIYSTDLGTLFKLDDENLTTGSLIVQSFGKGVIGDIIFAQGETMEYAMSIPLQTELFREAVFNHISNLPTVFTGFAFFNPGEETATVAVEAFGLDGQMVAEKALILGSGERIARILTDPDVWPSFPTQSGGYIRIRSDQPIAGQQLFGDRALRYMASVPATTRVEGMFD